MIFRINPSDEEPLYRQIVRQVREAIVCGSLQPGDRLPSQRALSRQLVINHLTVKKAYDLLESKQLVVTGAGRGTFISDIACDTDLKEEEMAEFAAALGRSVAKARVAGLSLEQLLAAARKSWRETR